MENASSGNYDQARTQTTVHRQASKQDGWFVNMETSRQARRQAGWQEGRHVDKAWTRGILIGVREGERGE